MSPRASWQSSSSSSRSSNRVSNPDIFSDEYALESLDMPETSPFDVDDDLTPTSSDPSSQNPPSICNSISPLLATSRPVQSPSKTYNPLGPRDVVSSTPNRSVSRASATLSDMHRGSSTSSHFSMPRAQSPYAGATGPSHPYAMYPQVTRASSIASASTVRPIERPFVAPSGPEHPYAMYPQNTVPEEDDASLAPATIPLGFPGMGQQYQRRAQTRDDIADIVGSDGHVEELPPYTRYADGAVPKQRSSSVRAAAVPTELSREASLLPQSSHVQHAGDDVELNTTVSGNTDSNSSGSFKEKVRQQSRQKICCGRPCWFFLIIVAVLLVGVIIGAAIGGVVGSKNGAEEGGVTAEPQNTSTPTATVTSTAFIDGAPLPTSHLVSDVPNGLFNLPTSNLVAYSQGCIAVGDLSHAWACMPPNGLGVDIVGQGQTARLILDSYPLDDSFLYGAQPPNLEQAKLNLVPSMDLDSNDLGPSLFAWTEYDKLTILHEDELQPNGEYIRDGRPKYGMPEHKPWFCWFNQTVIEFFIYVNKPIEPSAAATTSAESYASTALYSTSTSMSTMTSPTTSTHPVTSSASMPPKESDFRSGPGPKFWSTASKYGKRQAENENDEPRNGHPDYPLLVKIEEKRKPSHNIEPYCQQMQVLDNGQIVPLGNVAQISVPEVEAVDSLAEKRFRRKRRREDDLGLSLNCVCEWMTGEIY